MYKFMDLPNLLPLATLSEFSLFSQIAWTFFNTQEKWGFILYFWLIGLN